MQGDLADRLMIANLPQMSELTRRTERDMDARIRTLLPRLSGALFDSVARVLANPVELERMPRMADAAQIMAALDAQQRGSDVLQTYKKSQASAVSRVLESDPVAETLLRFMRQKARWAGTPTELYNEIARTTTLPDHNWPANAQKLSERLTRLTPALRQVRCRPRVRPHVRAHTRNAHNQGHTDTWIFNPRGPHAKQTIQQSYQTTR
jgi:hypothetical protein